MYTLRVSASVAARLNGLRFVQVNVYRLAELQPLVRQSLERVSRGGLASAEGRGDVAHGRLSCEEGRSRNSKCGRLAHDASTRLS